MSNFAPAFVTVNPSFIMPEHVIQYSLASGAFSVLPGENPMPRIGEMDLYVYIKYLQLTTQVTAGQATSNNLPSASVIPDYISTQTYRIQSRAQYDGFDEAASGQWGYSLPEAMRLANRQGIAQQMRNALLYGYNPANGEGIVNSAGISTQTLGADSNGNTGYTNWDSGQLAFYMSNMIGALKTRTNQIGMPLKFVFLAPQRFIQQITYAGIVSLTQFQRIGAGVETTAGLVESVARWSGGDEVVFAADDTLIGQGAGSTDLILLVAPELEVPDANTMVNTNIFAKLTPNTTASTLQLTDVSAPTEIPSPLPDGGLTVLYTIRTTSGVAFRPEAVTALSAAYA
jgi:hypothetical protein